MAALLLKLCVVLGLIVSPLIAESINNQQQSPSSSSQHNQHVPSQFRQNAQQFLPSKPQNSQNSVYGPKHVEEPKPSGFKTMLFRVLGIGQSSKPGPGQAPFQTMPPNFQQGGPCGIPLSTTTTTQSPYGPCPYPQGPNPPPHSPPPNHPPPPKHSTPFPPSVPIPTPSSYGPGGEGRPGGGGGSSAQVTADPLDNPIDRPFTPRPTSFPEPLFPVQEPNRVPPVPSFPVSEPGRVPPIPTNPVVDPFRVPPVGPYNPSLVPPVKPYDPVSDPARVPPVNPSPNPTGLLPPPQPPSTRPTMKPTRPPPPPPRPDMNQVYARRLPCSTLRPFIPSGFSYASLGNYAATQCDLIHPLSVNGVLRNEAPCSVMDSLKRLGANRFRELVIASGMDIVLTRLSNYTLFVPLDVAFSRLPAWLSSSLETDPKLQQAFVLNHFVKQDVSLSSMANEKLILNERPGGHRIRVNVYFEQFESPIYSVDGARIVRGDILVANGRLHLTDKVIMPNPSRNAAEYLSEKEAFEAFWNIVKNTNLELFQSQQPITLFIPLNSAVGKVDVAALMAEPDKLSRFVDHHLVNGTYYSTGMINHQYLTTNFNREIKIGIGSDSFSKYLTMINGHIRIVKSDIPLVNGVAHVVEECFSDQKSFYIYDEGDEFEFEYGVISKRSMKVTGEEKFLDF